MLAKYVHEEKSNDKSPVFIVEMPNKHFAGKRLSVTFIDGTGRTKYEGKARRFDEEFGYMVILPKGHPRWTLTAESRSERGGEYEIEDAPAAVLEEDDGYEPE